MRTFYDFDQKLVNTRMDLPVVFKRYQSLSDLPFDFTDKRIKPLNVDNEEIKRFEDLITRALISKFAVPTLSRSEMGALINVDEALDGIPECYRHARPVKSVLKIGLNLSADRNTPEVYALRCAAILAVVRLTKARGQQMQFDVCYGDSGVYSWNSKRRMHIRIMLQRPTTELIKIVMSPNFRSAMQHKVIEPSRCSAGYRLSMLPAALKGEFDFCLDRLETDNVDVEFARILKQIEHLRSH